jgi:curved DNA-binding protein CbpA
VNYRSFYILIAIIEFNIRMASTFYEVLGVSKFASTDDIKKSFKNLAKKYHPDKHPGSIFHEEHFKKINEAYQTLSNQQARSRYDLKINYAESSQPYTTNTQANRPRNTNPNPEKQYTQKAYKKPQSNRSAQSQKKLNRYYIYIAIGTVLFIIASTWFYNFMNDYAAKEYFTEGLQEEQKGNEVKAMGYYFSSLEKNFDNPITNEKIGDIYSKLAHNNSIELFYFDLELQKKNIDAGLDKESTQLLNNIRGIDSLSAMYFNRSFENYELDSDKRRVGLKLLRTDLKIGNFTKALSDSKRLKMMPDAAKDDSLIYYQAEIYFLMKDYEEARKSYTSFYAFHPTSADALIRIALCNYNEHNEDFAINQLDKAILKFPTKGEAYYFKGEIARRNQDSIAACNLFEIADQLNVLAAKTAIYKYCQTEL